MSVKNEAIKMLGQIAYEARFGTTPDRHPRWDMLHADEQAIWNRVAGAICAAAAPVMTSAINVLSAKLTAAQQGGVMNRLAILLDQSGEFAGVFSDEPIAVFIVDPNAPNDRVYAYGSTVIGADKVDEQVRGFVPDPQGNSFGHAGVDAVRLPELPRPALRIVQPEDGA